MDKNEGTIVGKLFLSMPKSINAMSDLEQKSKKPQITSWSCSFSG